MNRKLILSTVILLFIGTYASQSRAQSLSIRLKDGTTQNVELKSLQKIYFSSNSMMLNYSNGTTGTIGIPTINKMLLSTTTLGIDKNWVNGNTMSLFFNSADNTIHFQNAPEEISPVTIYRPDGIIVLRTAISDQNSFLNVSSLANGIYLLRVNNQMLKFKK